MAAVVEYAKSGRSQCFFCCQKISLDALRFRMPLEPKWRCLECFALVVPEQQASDVLDSCHGVGNLNTDDQLLLTEFLKTWTYPPWKKLKGAKGARRANKLGELWLRSEEHRGLRQCAREWARNEIRSEETHESDSVSSRAGDREAL